MPPEAKKKASRKKKKVEVLPLVKPEAPDGDEVEIAMLWDRISKQRPNPMQPQGGLIYNYSASATISAGPLPKEVVAMASATVPLIATAPVVAPSPVTARSRDKEKDGAAPSPSNTAKDGGAKNQGAAAASPVDGGNAGSGISGSGSGSGVGFSSDVASLLTLTAVPKPPARRAPETARAVFRLAAAEREANRFLEKSAGLDSDERQMLNVVEYDRRDYGQQKSELRAQIEVLEGVRQQARVRFTEIADKQHMHFETLKFRLEEDLRGLLEDRDRVESELAEKVSMLSKREQLEREVTALQLRHSEHLKDTHKTLEDHKNTVRNTMVSRLLQTTEEMKAITASQREMRQQRAVAEAEKLTAELTALERRSKALNATNARLVAQADVTARDRALEADRRKLLLRKNATLSSEIKDLVTQLQSLEKSYATKAAVAAPSRELQALSDTVDRQYGVILQLKGELDAVSDDIYQCRARIDDTRRRQLAAVPDSSHLHQHAITDGPSRALPSVPMLDPSSIEVARRTAIESLVEVDKELRRLSVADGLLSVVDPKEKLKIQNATVRRIKLAISDVMPHAPAPLAIENRL